MATFFLRIERAVTVNGSYQPINTTVGAGDTINLNFTQVETSQAYLPSQKLPDIVYEDNDIIVINKPAGQKKLILTDPMRITPQ